VADPGYCKGGNFFDEADFMGVVQSVARAPSGSLRAKHPEDEIFFLFQRVILTLKLGGRL